MALRAFNLSLDISSERVPAEMLGELATLVLRQAGGNTGLAAALEAALRQGADQGAFTGGRCHVLFRAQDGALDILVSAAGGAFWRTSCAIS